MSTSPYLSCPVSKFSIAIPSVLIPEPAGSAALAGLLSNQIDLAQGSKVVVLVSGGNIDFDRLAKIINDFSLGYGHSVAR